MSQNTANTQFDQVTVKSAGGLNAVFSPLVIFGSILVGYLIYYFIFGASSNFIGGDTANHPVDEGFGKVLGLFYKGGFVIGLAVGLFLMMLTFTIERFITLTKATGKGSLDVFVQKIQIALDRNDLDGAVRECDENGGTVGNVVKEVLRKYREVQNDTTMDKETKTVAIQKALEEAVALEVPTLERNLVIIATLVSLGTLVGLIGTVLGMIRAFSALGAGGGSPDASALSVGISEALMNTALGITTSTIATVSYNFLNAKIDGLTYKMDEAGFSIVQTFVAKHK